MDFLALISLVAGLLLLVIGAEVLVKGAGKIAAAVGLSPLIIGLTVVSYGTSAPELFVSLRSSLAGQGDIAVGNVVGSNIFNVLLVLGISALFSPLLVSQQLIRLDVPIMVGVSILMPLLALDGQLSNGEGVLLMAGAVGYTVFLIYQGRRENDPAVQDEYAREYSFNRHQSLQQWLVNVGFLLVGFVCLVLGSDWLVSGAVSLAQGLGLSQLIIGLTIIAAGTSLPELATSVVATIRGERDIAVGNVVGSNIFNILAVLGTTSAVSPEGIQILPAALRFDIPVLVAVAIACLPIFFSGNVINRWEGMLFVGYYIAYTTYIVLDATNSHNLGMYSLVLGGIVIPLSAITLLIICWREYRKAGPG